MRVELEPQNFNGVRGVERERDFTECIVVYSKPGTLVRLAPNWCYVAKPIPDEPEVEVSPTVENLARLLQIESALKDDADRRALKIEANLDAERKRRILVETELRLALSYASSVEKHLASAKAAVLRMALHPGVDNDDDGAF